jgi:fluoride exporter
MTDPDLRAAIAVALGAVAGALSRYYLNAWLGQQLGNNFPWGTLTINLSGCLLMGLIVGVAQERSALAPAELSGWLSPEIYTMLTTGFLGAYTTFSTYGLDTIKLLADRWQWGIAYALSSAIFGILNVRLGLIIAHWFRS